MWTDTGSRKMWTEKMWTDTESRKGVNVFLLSWIVVSAVWWFSGNTFVELGSNNVQS